MIARVKAADIPLPLLHAYVDALEAWGLLEHELFMVWQMFDGQGDIDQAWAEYSSWSTAKQRRKTVALVEAFHRETGSATRIPDAFGRLEELTGTRNRIVHGYWHPIELVIGGRVAGREFIRQYDARGEQCRPVDEADEQRMLGQSRFYEPQLREAERQFRKAARDIHFAKADIIGWRHR